MISRKEKIILAEKCGLIYCRKDREEYPEFMGTVQSWNKFTKELEKYE